MIYNREYSAGEDLTNPYLSPLFGDFSGFPPMLIQVGSYEMLLSDSVSVAQKAKDAGVKVRLSIYEGMFHVFQMAPLALPECKRAWVEIGHFIDEISGGAGENEPQGENGREC
jgi:acetyl esterase/lipase